MLLDAQDATPWESLRAYTLKQPEFANVGVGDSLLGARFTDGRVFVYFDNCSKANLPDPAATPAEAAAMLAAAPVRTTAATPAPRPAPRMRALAAATVPEVPGPIDTYR
jgi:hypothetical protein